MPGRLWHPAPALHGPLPILHASSENPRGLILRSRARQASRQGEAYLAGDHLTPQIVSASKTASDSERANSITKSV